MIDAARLPPIPLFSDLDLEETRALVALGRLTEIDGGRVVFAEGEGGGEMHIVLSGFVVGRRSLPDGTEREVGSFEPGDFFGEMGIFEGLPRSAGCRTTCPTRLLTLTADGLRLFSRDRPEAAVRLLGTLAAIITRRLREKSGLLASMVAWGEQATRRAFTDDITGAYNRRYFDQALADGCEAARREGGSIAVAMADVDDFRRVNESLTQTTGNVILREIAAIIGAGLRDSDTLARYGGDEIALVLPGRSLDESAELCRAACRAVEQSPRWRELGVATPVTVSLGCACSSGGPAEAEGLLRRADEALYRAKRSGKNTVEKALG